MKIEINNGVVTNDGAELGTIQDGTCYLLKNCAPNVKGEIRKAAGNADLKFIVGAAPIKDGDKGKRPDGIAGAQGPGPHPNGDTATPPPSVVPPVENNPSDPMPPRNLILGSKCPNLIAWKARQQKGGK